MLTINYQGQFKKDFKRVCRRGWDSRKLKRVIRLIMSEEPLPVWYRDHSLECSRNYKHMRECHIEPDWLLIYQIIKPAKTLNLIRTGSHSDLF